jgi:hypothetical protein
MQEGQSPCAFDNVCAPVWSDVPTGAALYYRLKRLMGTSKNQIFCFPARKASFDDGEYIQHIRPVGERSLTPPWGKEPVFRGSLKN